MLSDPVNIARRTSVRRRNGPHCLGAMPRSTSAFAPSESICTSEGAGKGAATVRCTSCYAKRLGSTRQLVAAERYCAHGCHSRHGTAGSS